MPPRGDVQTLQETETLKVVRGTVSVVVEVQTHVPEAPNFNYNVSHEGNYVVLASEPVRTVPTTTINNYLPVDALINVYTYTLFPKRTEPRLLHMHMYDR